MSEITQEEDLIVVRVTDSQMDRKPNFTRSEELLLVGEYVKVSRHLESKFGPAVTNKSKRAAWQQIADALNSQNTDVVRTVEEVKKKYKNLNQSARRKYDQQRRPKTGGEPLVRMTDAEEVLMTSKEGRPSLEGLPAESAVDVPAFADVIYTCTDLLYMIGADGLLKETKAELPVKTEEECFTPVTVSSDVEGVENHVEIPAPILPEVSGEAQSETCATSRPGPRAKNYRPQDVQNLYAAYLIQATRTEKAREEVLLLKKRKLEKELN